jgi:hypothetical protein
MAIAKQSRKTTFYAYTRSWDDPAILKRLVMFASLENVHLWFSEDFEAGVAPSVSGIRRAYMLEHNANKRFIHPGVDLVFPVKAVPSVKRYGSTLVCPYDQKIERKVRITCDRCRICFTQSKGGIQ